MVAGTFRGKSQGCGWKQDGAGCRGGAELRACVSRRRRQSGPAHAVWASASRPLTHPPPLGMAGSVWEHVSTTGLTFWAFVSCSAKPRCLV